MKSSRKPRILTGLGLAILIVLAIFAVPPSVFFVLCLALFWQGSVELVRILRFWAPGSPLGLLLILWPMAAVA